MKLVKYRDSGMHTYTYFWVDEENRVFSPYFNHEADAEAWMELEKYKIEAQEMWSDSCTTQRKE